MQAVQLTKAEKLQLLNLKPSSAVRFCPLAHVRVARRDGAGSFSARPPRPRLRQVEIHLIVEDCEERLSAEEIEQIVVIVQELL